MSGRVDGWTVDAPSDHQHCFHLLITFFCAQKLVQERMTSIEIAEVTGKPHNDVLKAIRAMEPAWEKVSQGKFSLSSRKVEQPNGGIREYPCYSLTKTYELLHLCAANNGGEHKKSDRPCIQNLFSCPCSLLPAPKEAELPKVE